MVRLVIFDVDGTLVDSQNIIVEAQRRTFRAHGLAAPSRERSLSIVGLSLPEAFTALVGADGPVPALVETYKQVFGDLRQDPDYAEPLFPGRRADSVTAAPAARYTSCHRHRQEPARGGIPDRAARFRGAVRLDPDR